MSNDEHIQYLAEKCGKGILEEICEALCAEGSYGRVFVVEEHKHDAINSSGKGIITLDDESEIEFTFRNGNWNGLEIFEVGESVSYESPKPQRRIFVLDEARIPEGKLDLMREKYRVRIAEIDEKARAMNYDMYFSPSYSISKHYNDWLKENYLKIEWV